MSLFKRRPKRNQIDPGELADLDAAKRAAAAVNRGDMNEADRICEATGNARATAFAAFRWIDVEAP